MVDVIHCIIDDIFHEGEIGHISLDECEVALSAGRHPGSYVLAWGSSRDRGYRQ